MRGRPKIYKDIPYKPGSSSYAKEVRSRNKGRYAEYARKWRQKNPDKWNMTVKASMSKAQTWEPVNANKRWSESEIKQLLEHEGKLTDLARRLGRSYGSVLQKKSELTNGYV